MTSEDRKSHFVHFNKSVNFLKFSVNIKLQEYQILKHSEFFLTLYAHKNI